MTKMDQSLIEQKKKSCNEAVGKLINIKTTDTDVLCAAYQIASEAWDACHTLLSAKLEAYQEANRQLTRMMDINDEFNDGEVARYKERISTLEALLTRAFAGVYQGWGDEELEEDILEAIPSLKERKDG